MPLPTPAVGVPGREEPHSPQHTELAILRQSVQAARSETRAAKLDAEAAKRALKEAEKALRREQARIEDPDAGFVRKIAARAFHKLLKRITRAATHAFKLPRLRIAIDGDGNPSQFSEAAAPSISAVKSLDARTTPIEEPDLFALRVMAPRGRVAVVVHLAHSTLWSGLSRDLTNIPEAFDLFVTLAKDSAAGAAELIHESFPAAQVLEFEPRGRDIYPFVALINSGVLFQYDVVCKLHVQGKQWDQNLVGDPTQVGAIFAAFDADPKSWDRCRRGKPGEARAPERQRP